MKISDKQTFDFNLFIWSCGYFKYCNNGIFGEILFFEENNIVFSIIKKQKKGFKIGYILNVPILKNGSKLPVDVEADFLNSFIDFVAKNKIFDFIFPPLHFDNFKIQPKKTISFELGIIKLSLKKDLDEIFNSFKSQHKRYIKKAEKDQVKVKFGTDKYFDDFYEVYSNRLSKEADGYFDSKQKIKDLLLNSDNKYDFQCGIAYLNDEAQAAILNISDSYNGYYLFGGVKDKSHNGAFRLLHWELIKLYKEKGLDFYQLGAYRGNDIMTDKHQKLANFKLGFGPEIQEGFIFTIVLSKFKYRLYNLLINLKSLLR